MRSWVRFVVASLLLTSIAAGSAGGQGRKSGTDESKDIPSAITDDLRQDAVVLSSLLRFSSARSGSATFDRILPSR